MDDETGMWTVAQMTGLIDVFSHKFGTKEEPATYIQGNQQIDYLLASNSILPAIIKGGYEAYHSTFPSNHRGLWLNFDTKKLFGGPNSDLQKYETRDFFADWKTAKVYCNIEAENLRTHHDFSRCLKIMQDMD